MIHNDVQNQLALLVKTSAPPLIEIAQSPIETPQWTPGQRLPAHVIASLPNGRFQVQVEDQTLDMNLPAETAPGQKLELTFISTSPRLTFALTQDLARATPSNSGVSLSETAKFLGALLQRGDSQNASANALGKATAVLSGAPAAIQDFAASLRTAVSQSGLFYESHQAQWVSGERTLASLLQEPQANLPLLPRSEHGSASVPDSSVTPKQAGEKTMLMSNGEMPPAAVRAGESTVTSVKDFSLAPTKLAAESNFAIPRDPVHPQAAPMVQQQLETLDTRQIVWQGQVWPGQDMDWEIEEDAAHGGPDGNDPVRWRTRLHLELPDLGGVTARLALSDSGVRVDFSAAKGKTAALMRDEASALARSMEASGLRIAGLMVREGDGK